MTVTIRHGAKYLTRGKKVAGPMRASNAGHGYAFSADVEGELGSRIYQADGRHGSTQAVQNNPDLDLVSEISESLSLPSPVRKVERVEIVPGTYGRVRVWPDHPSEHVRLSVGETIGVGCYDFHATELRAAISTLTAIAEALEANKTPTT